MDNRQGSRRAILLAAALAAGCMAGGCAGPSTRVLPQESKETFPMQEEPFVLEESNPFYLQEELEILAASPRVCGSEQDREAVRYIRQLLEDYGYETSLQQFARYLGSEEERVIGTNVVAVRLAQSPDADIIILGASHNTLPGSPGAGDSASAVAVLLETARLLSRMPTDTELRFISFSGYPQGMDGCRFYVDSLSEEERYRVIGAIQLDELDCSVNGGITLETEDGKPTMLGDVLLEASQELLRESWSYEQGEGSHSRFVRGRMPAVSVRQSRESYVSGSRFDRPEIVDIERLAQIVNVLSRALSDIMSPDTPSMMAKAHHYNDLRDTAYIQPVRMPIPFGETPRETEERMSMEGSLVAENTDREGNEIIAYQYPVKWLGVNQVLLTNCYYTNGRLSVVTVDGDGAGVDFADMQERLVTVYGMPAEINEGPAGTGYVWKDTVSRTSVLMTPETEGYELEFQEYTTERTVEDSYGIISSSEQNPQLSLGRREAEGQNAQDFRVNVLLTLVRQLLPMRQEQRLLRVDLYTDGIGKTKTFLEVIPPEEDAAENDEPVFVWGVDVEDALTADGRWQNETDFVRQILLLYGQMLEQTESYRLAFAAAFPEEEDPGIQVQLGVKPGDYVEPPPDMKESFLWFVLTDQPGEESGSWGARIRFFYRFEELVAYRTQIRNNLKIGD